MDEAEIEFIESMGLMFKEDGLPRIAGRIHGLLLLSEEALSLDQMADELQVSKASTSTNARMLERMGLVERTGKPGDRRDYYRSTGDAIEGSLERVRRRMELMLDLLESTIPEIDNQREVARMRLETMRDWHRFLLVEMEDLLDRWHEHQEDDDEESGRRETTSS